MTVDLTEARVTAGYYSVVDPATSDEDALVMLAKAFLMAEAVVEATGRFLNAEAGGVAAVITDAHMQLLHAMTDYRAAVPRGCPAGVGCALNKGAVHCRHCRRNWPRDETWDMPLDFRPNRGGPWPGAGADERDYSAETP